VTAREVTYSLAEVGNLVTFSRTTVQRCIDHALLGGRRGFRDCYIEPDWVLVYKVDSIQPVLVLTETGTHEDLGL